MSSPFAEPCGEPRQPARIAPEFIDKMHMELQRSAGRREETMALRVGRLVSTNECVLNGHSGGAAWAGAVLSLVFGPERVRMNVSVQAPQPIASAAYQSECRPGGPYGALGRRPLSGGG